MNPPPDDASCATPPGGDTVPGTTMSAAGRHKWYGGAVVALVFLLIAMVQVVTSGHSLSSIITFEVFACLFAAAYMVIPPWATGALFHPPATRTMTVRAWAGLAVMLTLTIPMIAVGGRGVTGLWIYVSVAGAVMLTTRVAVVVAALFAAAMIVVSLVAEGGDLAWSALPWELAATLIAITLWMVAFAANIRTTVQLRAAQHALAEAAVTAERERIGRDLHDILGHSLTAIAVKAALAGRLLGRDDAAAGSEIADVERLARDALTDVRATASGYRNVSLAGEIAVARAVLQAADIRADLPGSVDNVSPEGRQLFGYVVREAVTNVVRHSGARQCSVELTENSVSIVDDGVGSASSVAAVTDAPPGHGLAGLAERVAAVGGHVEAGPRPSGGFAVCATIPAGAGSGADARSEANPGKPA